MQWLKLVDATLWYFVLFCFNKKQTTIKLMADVYNRVKTGHLISKIENENENEF